MTGKIHSTDSTPRRARVLHFVLSMGMLAIGMSGCNTASDCDPATEASCVCTDDAGVSCTAGAEGCGCALRPGGDEDDSGRDDSGPGADVGADAGASDSGAADASASDSGAGDASALPADAGPIGPQSWPEDLPLIELDADGRGSVTGTFASGVAMPELSWARSPGIGCWDNPLTDEFYSQNHIIYGLAAPIPAWHEVTVTITPAEAQSEANGYALLQDERSFFMPTELDDGICHRNTTSPGPGEAISFSFRVHETPRQNALIGVGNRGRWRMDDSAEFTIEVQLTPIEAADRCYGDVEQPHRWQRNVNTFSLDANGRAIVPGNLAEGRPLCDLQFLNDEFCVPSIRLSYFNGNHVFYALDGQLPAETYATVTITPDPGVDVNLYGGSRGTTNFRIPPAMIVSTCEASLQPRFPLREGPDFTNIGSPESFWIWTGNNPANLFFAVAAPEGENGKGGFTVSVETIDTSTDRCTDDDYRAVSGLDAWPAQVETIALEDGRGRVEGDTASGTTPCTLDWAASSQNACFPATKNAFFAGKTVYYAIDELVAPGSLVSITAVPEAGVDVNLFAYHLGADGYVVPPLVPGVGVCEASYPLNLDEAANPDVNEHVQFFTGRGGNRFFIGVAAREEDELGGAFALEIEVTEPPPPHCPESLPGANYPAWPGIVQQIELDEAGRGSTRGDLADGQCVNVEFASNSNVACFPATQFDRYEGNHVFFALAEPIPPRSVLTVIATPTDGGEISLYGLQTGTQTFPVPPAINGGICEASNGWPGANPGEAERIRFFNPSDRNLYNIFLAVAGDDATGAAGTFDLDLELEVGVVHCEESLPGQNLEAYPDSVQRIAFDETGNWLGQGNLSSGSCTNLDFASDSNVACFPSTQNAQYTGNHVYFALAEPMPPRSILTITAEPVDPEQDISLYGLQRGTDAFNLPPAIPGGICETSNGHPGGNPGALEAIEFQNPSDRNEYNVLVAVAGTEEGGDAGRFRLSASLQVGQTHCPESLPGQRFDDWPNTVQRVSLEDGQAVVRGNLNTGKCVNLAWAANSQTACFPATIFDRFEGNHVFFVLDSPLPPRTTLEIDPSDGFEIYAYTIGVDGAMVPPYVPSVVSCEYGVSTGDAVRLNTVANPYQVFFAVTGPAGAVDGEFEVRLRTLQ